MDICAARNPEVHSLPATDSVEDLLHVDETCASDIDGARMRFVAILPVRDEVDIIAQFLGRLLRWADAIYAFHTSNVHNKWRIVRWT